ncbi:MAG: regulator of PEP synthase PpsR (kinase-PPPase family) [Rhodothermales bacterium]|jgi:regulator of PEP synthase PpsR (kinase-PPPase family)
MKRTVFFVSDGTAITTETLGHSLLTQFPDIEFIQERLPFISSVASANVAVVRINEASKRDGAAAIVFNTIVDEDLCVVIRSSDGVILDLFAAFLKPLERALGTAHEPTVGRAHGVYDVEKYEDRMSATNYAMTHDDGISIDFAEADLILVGVSRSGKTPTCLYMALHFGVKAANYPLTPEDLDEMRLPSFLRRYKRKIAGLMIEPERLTQIRETRKPGSRYASIRQCRQEVDAAESLFRMEGIPVFHTTHSSIEEISSRVLLQLGLQREMF